MLTELGSRLTISQDQQLQQIVDKTILEGDHDGCACRSAASVLTRCSDGKLSFEEFKGMISSQDFAKQMTLVRARPALDFC